VVTVDPAVGDDQFAPARRHERHRRISGHGARAGAVQVEQHLDRIEQLAGGRARAEAERLEHPWGERAHMAVAVIQLRVVVVIRRAGDPLCVRGDLGENLGRLVLPDRLAHARIRNRRVEHDLEQLREQADLLVLAGRRLELLLDQPAPRTAVRGGDRLIEQVHDLVGHVRRLIGAERDERRMADPLGAALERLVRRPPRQLRQIPTAVRIQPRQIPAVGTHGAQVHQLRGLAQHPARARLAFLRQPCQAGHRPSLLRELHVRKQERLQLRHQAPVEHWRQLAMGRALGVHPSGGDRPLQHRQPRPRDLLRAQRPACLAQQGKRRVMLKRSLKQPPMKPPQIVPGRGAEARDPLRHTRVLRTRARQRPVVRQDLGGHIQLLGEIRDRPSRS